MLDNAEWFMLRVLRLYATVRENFLWICAAGPPFISMGRYHHDSTVSFPKAGGCVSCHRVPSAPPLPLQFPRFFSDSMIVAMSVSGSRSGL